MYKTQEYTNTLQNVTLIQFPNCRLKNGKDVKILYSRSIFDNENVYSTFQSVLKHYSEYIQNMEAMISIWNKMETVQYINLGMRKEDEWKYNEHLFIINGHKFEYKTGVGINCKENKGNLYNYYKLIFNAMYCILQEANIAINYSEEDFLQEFGYEENVKSYKKGKKVYADMKANAEKTIEVFGRDAVYNLYDIIQL